MTFRSILLFFLFSKCIFCFEVDEIDETIIGEKKEFYYFSKKPKKYSFTYQIKKDSNKRYFEIVYFYSKITIQKEDTIIYQSETEHEKLGEYSFTFEHDGSNYYMLVEYSTTFTEFGFTLKSQSSEYNYILSSSKTIEVLNERSFNLIIENKENEKTIICVKIPTDYRINNKGKDDT